MPQIPDPYASALDKLIISIVVVIVTMVILRFVGALVARGVRDASHAHRLRVFFRNTVIFLAGVALLLAWLGMGTNFAVLMGVLGAGIAVASQETVGSFAGYLNIVSGNLFRIGDRVQLGSVTGDVVDISILRTTVMEVGDWAKSDQYTGRIVSIANRAVFSAPVFNYTQHWPFVLDELTMTISYSSNWRGAQEIMLEQGRVYSEPFLQEAQAQLDRMQNRYLIQGLPLDPLLHLQVVSNRIELTLRYVVAVRVRRDIRTQLYGAILEGFQQVQDITVA